MRGLLIACLTTFTSISKFYSRSVLGVAALRPQVSIINQSAPISTLLASRGRALTGDSRAAKIHMSSIASTAGGGHVLNDDIANGTGRGTQRGKKGSKDDDTAIKTWKERIEASIAKSRRIRGGNYVQIATVDEDGHPRCRTVVFR